METKDYLKYTAEMIHTVIMATIDEQGRPVTAAIDIMDADQDSLYFLTARGKAFYERVRRNGFIAFTGLKGEDTMSSVSVSVQASVTEMGSGMIPELFRKNPYMAMIYPTEESRQALTVFRIHDGTGEWFDLSRRPIERDSFTFGTGCRKEAGYRISEQCTGCGACIPVCPQNCIDPSAVPYRIKQENCLHCGNCQNVCPANAVERRS